MKKILIGIDPDVDKSGVAIIHPVLGVFLFNITFFELFNRLKLLIESPEPYDIIIYVECGFLNKSNWHRISNGNSNLNSKIGERTGANFETAKKICEMCEYLGLEYVKVKPTKSKVNAETFKKFTGIETRTNQEVRDAFMLIYGK